MRLLRTRPCVPLAAVVSFLILPLGSARADIAGAPAPVHAITGARVVTGPGAMPVSATIVVRDGRIEVIGTDVSIPADAMIHERPGRVIYAGLIEPYLRLPHEDSGDSTGGGARHENERVRAEVRAIDRLPLDEETLESFRAAGFTTAFVAPGRGVFRGTGSVIALADGFATEQILRADHAQVFAFERGRWPDREYPNSLMGSIALARQALHDVEWQRASRDAWSKDPQSMTRPEENVSLRALEPALARSMPIFMESESVAMLPRALAVAREFRLAPVIVSGGSDEYRRIRQVASWLRDAEARLVVSVNFPDAPSWTDEEDRTAIELDDLRHWDRAPTNLRALERAQVEFAVTTQGLGEPSQVLAELRRAIDYGLSPRAALAALTTEPARLLGIADRLGTLAAGKDATFLVATTELFDPQMTIEEVWIDGVRHGPDPQRASASVVAGKWDLEISGAAGSARRVRVQFEDKTRGFQGKAVNPDDDTDEAATPGERTPGVDLEEVEIRRGEITFILPAQAWEGGDALVALRRDDSMLRGTLRESGQERHVLGRKVPKLPRRYDDDRVAISENEPEWPPVYSPADASRAVHVRNATIWTVGPQGVLEGADLVAVDGKILSVGKGLGAPAGATVIDGTGLHVTPGLIDCHSHSSISGGVNEGTNSCTAEVRIGDVVNPDSPAIYRELAGGLTISNLLHGSANTIGGQNAVIKLRWGQPAGELPLDGAPPGIKCALGENVKQSNWGDDHKTRYPQTRMGVEQFLRDRYHAARVYADEWDVWRKKRKGAPPRRDLQLDTLVEILDGERLVHCHSYRSDEIIMYLRVAEDFGFRIATFQHVLEGYKCANELAAHGAGASAFSDWWSYKFEVVDAIPYAGKMMWERGVLTSFNSDSSELSRRMNLEAAKAVKYGGVPEEEALAFVTWNPAKQLGIEDRVGSLEAGKDADFVLWTDHPLSDFATVDQTWIDGVMRFSRDRDLAGRDGAEALRERLLAKAEAHRRATKDVSGTKRNEPTFGQLHGEESGGWVLRRGECVASEAATCCEEAGS